MCCKKSWFFDKKMAQQYPALPAKALPALLYNKKEKIPAYRWM